MPFPYELYPKAKETHCLNLPEISVSRPPFPGSIRTADGCLWGWRDNNSYADTTITASDGTSYKYGTVFTEKTTKGEGIACSSYANCYIGCSCNTSDGCIHPVRAATANPQPTITIPELTPFLRVNQFPMSPQSPLPVQIQVFLLLPPPPPVSKPPLRPVTTRSQQLPPPPQQQAPPPASPPWPPALLPATRKRPVPKAVTTIPSRLTKSALQRVTTDTPAIPVAAIRLAPTMATILPFLPEKPVLPFIPAPV